MGRCQPAWHLPPCRCATAVLTCLSLLAAAARADTLLMTTGERLQGRLVGEEGNALVFESDALGVVRVPRVRIESVSAQAASAAALEAAVAEAPVPLVGDAAPEDPVVALEDRTASELPPDRPVPPSAPETRKKEDLLRLWVDQGLRYQIVQPVVIGRPFQDAPPLMDEAVRVTGRIGIRASVEHVQIELLLFDLLLEEGVQHDRAGSGPFQGQQHVRILAEGAGCPHHQGAAQLQAEIGGGQVGAHGCTSGSVVATPARLR